MKGNALCTKCGTRKIKLIYPVKSNTSQAKKSHAEKARNYKHKKEGPEWNDVAYEVKINKSYYFTHPAKDNTNSHPQFNQTERMGTWKKRVNTVSNKK